MTLLADLSRYRWDAVIVGAGPAGALSAALLARRGWRVLLVERKPWPREKVCGGCLNAAAVRRLESLGLGEVLADAPVLHSLAVHIARRRVALPIPPGAVVERQSFDSRLVDVAVGHGCEFSPGTHARLLGAVAGDDFRCVQLSRDGEETQVYAKIVLACDGLRGSIFADEPGGGWQAASRSHLGFAATVAGYIPAVPAGTIAMCVGNHGYVGLVGYDGGRVHVGAALEPAACHDSGGPGPVIRGILETCGVELPTLEGATFYGTPPLTGRREAVAGNRVLAVGDACGYVEPFTGEGMSWAIRGAAACAELLGQRPAWTFELGSAWQWRHSQEIVRRQGWCRWFSVAMKHPLLSAACLGAARCVPWMPALVARRISA